MFINRIYTLIIFLFISAAGVAAQSSTVSGTVQDSANAAVPGATVIIRNIKTGAERTTTVDIAGRFSLSIDGDAAQFEMIVLSKGFGRFVKPLSGGDSDVTLTLTPSPISEEVTVTATRTQVLTTETAVPVSVVGREDIDRKAPNSIGDIFRTLPGTSTANEGAFQVRPRIRGLDSNRVLILVDGERLNNSRTSTGQSGVEAGLVELSTVESVEVIRGSGSVLYGTDALGGTINIITNDTPMRRDGGFRFGAVLDTFYSSNDNGRRGSLAVNGANKHFAFRLAQSLERFDNYFTGKPNAVFLQDFRTQTGTITNDGEVPNSQSHGGNTQATTRFFLNDNSTIKLNYERRRGANIGSAGLVNVFNGFFPFSNRDKFSGRYDVAALTKNLQRLSASGFYQTQDRDFTNILTVAPAPPFFPGIYQISQTITNTKTSGFDLQTDWTLGGRNSLTAGASFFRDTNKDDRQITKSTTPASVNRTITNTKSVPDASLANVAAFAQDEFRVTNRLKFVGGIRVDNFKTVSQPTTGFVLPNLTAAQITDLGIGGLATGLNISNTSVTGDVGAIYRVNNEISVSARVGRSFRTPNIFEFFFTDAGSISGVFVVGNQQLKPESGVNFDANFKYHTSKFAASATYFRNSYKNFLNIVAAVDRNGAPIFLNQPGPPVRVYQTQNLDKALIQGFEAEFEVPIKISFGYLTPNGNFSYLRGDNTRLNTPLDIISPMRTTAGFRWNNFGKAYFFDYNARIVTKQTRLSPAFLLPVNQGGNGGPEPGFVTHNINGGYYFGRERYGFNINVGVSNLFDRAYSEQFVFAPARGRSFTIGTSIHLK
ncbi:MAG: TonB-dependent receptor [Chloracidobacterium sp.]|nr:TonB-dependent receptor [Chloracidobacterium sp.]